MRSAQSVRESVSRRKSRTIPHLVSLLDFSPCLVTIRFSETRIQRDR